MKNNTLQNKIIFGIFLFLVFTFIITLFSNIVLAQNYFSFPGASALRELESRYAPIFDFLKMFFNISTEFQTEIPIMAFLCLILWVFLSISFSGIIQDFTLFSNLVSKLIGWTMTTIMALTGLLSGMIGFFYLLFGQLGAIIFVLLIICGSFLIEKSFSLNIKKKKIVEKKLKRKMGKKYLENVGTTVLDDRRKVNQNADDTSTWD